jgi:hypothetical protein
VRTSLERKPADVSHDPSGGVHITQTGPSTPARRRPASLHSSVVELHRLAGNRAVTGLVGGALQRAVGWTDASKKGHAWNVDERAVGKVRRIPLEGLSEGLSMNRRDEKAQVWVWDDKPARKGHMDVETTRVPALSTEGAKGKAIVLVPEALDATKAIEVLVFLHGFTEDAGRPFGGWRTLDTAPRSSGKMKDLRQGVDAADVAPVRDVALDQAEQQLEESGQKQLVIVLPQGGLHSQFGKDGGQNFEATAYVSQIVTRLQTEQRWKDGAGKVAKAAPVVSRINMAGHSGAGAALTDMRKRITGDLVIYDAINGGQLGLFEQWALARLDEDLAVLTDKTKTDAQKLAYLQTAQKLRAYTTDAYIGAYIKLDDAIAAWFTRNSAKLGAFAACLRANYFFEYVDVHHEELMRGSAAGGARTAGTGTILDAVKGLHPALPASTAACPPMPQPLSARHKAAKSKSKGR